MIRRIVDKPWFGHAVAGSMWGPKTWQGRIAVVVAIALVVVDLVVLGRTLLGYVGVALLAVAFFVVMTIAGPGDSG